MNNRFMVEPVERDGNTIYYLKDRKTQELSISYYSTESAAKEMCDKKNEKWFKV